MARKSAGRILSDLAIYAISFVLIGIALIIMLFREYPLQMIALTIAVVGAVHLNRERRRRKVRANIERAIECTDKQIERHQSALISYYRQSVRPGAFGGEDTRKWEKKIGTFLETQVLPGLSMSGIEFEDGRYLAEHVDLEVRDMADRDQPGDPAELNWAKFTPRQYERECAEILSRGGWTVRLTPVTGDNGADVIAEKGQARLIIQCKLYSRPVSNKGVQEAYSALRLYDGTHACVVAPQGYTAPAQRAAHGLGVRLLHHLELGAYADEISGGSEAVARRAFG